MIKQKTLQDKVDTAQDTVNEIKKKLLSKRKEGFILISKYNKEIEEIDQELKKAEAKLEIRKEDLEDSTK